MAVAGGARDEVYLDSNVAFYSVTGDREYGRFCSPILADIESGALRACASVLIVAEVANAVRKIGRAREMERVVAAMTSLPVRYQDVTEPLVVEGARLARRAGCSPYDGVHVATMFDLGVARIISTDADFDRFHGVDRLDPRSYMANREEL